MDKAEAKKEISLLRQKRQNAIDDARITYLEGFIDGQKELEQYSQQVNQLGLADAQFIGFKQGKWDADIVSLVKSMGLLKTEWEKWKNDYVNVLDDQDLELIEDYFKHQEG